VAATGLLYPAHNVRHYSKEVQACLPEFSSPST
jgi:hypothetical protein